MTTQLNAQELQLQDFCKWAESLDMDLTQIGNTKTGDINFSDCNTDYAWEAWQAARAPLLSTIAQQGEALETLTVEDAVNFMAVALRHTEYKRGTSGPSTEEILEGFRHLGLPVAALISQKVEG